MHQVKDRVDYRTHKHRAQQASLMLWRPTVMVKFLLMNNTQLVRNTTTQQYVST